MGVVMGTEINWRRLLAAILAQAVIDAQSTDPAVAAPARRWLASTGIEMVQWLDISLGRVTTWVSDLPDHRRLFLPPAGLLAAPFFGAALPLGAFVAVLTRGLDSIVDSAICLGESSGQFFIRRRTCTRY
jgi:hypothetical protein